MDYQEREEIIKYLQYFKSFNLTSVERKIINKDRTFILGIRENTILQPQRSFYIHGLNEWEIRDFLREKYQ